jgi:hypothetical protein
MSDGWKQQAVETAKIAGNVFVRLHGLDAFNGGRVALIEQPCRLLAAGFGQRGEAIVTTRRQVHRCARSHSLANRAAIDHHNV